MGVYFVCHFWLQTAAQLQTAASTTISRKILKIRKWTKHPNRIFIVYFVRTDGEQSTPLSFFFSSLFPPNALMYSAHIFLYYFAKHNDGIPFLSFEELIIAHLPFQRKRKTQKPNIFFWLRRASVVFELRYSSSSSSLRWCHEAQGTRPCEPWSWCAVNLFMSKNNRFVIEELPKTWEFFHKCRINPQFALLLPLKNKQWKNNDYRAWR